MSVKVYCYVQDGGDGSYSLLWFKRELDGGENDYIEYLSDGDGLGPKLVLTFESYEAAQAVGIRFSAPEDYEGQEEDEE